MESLASRRDRRRAARPRQNAALIALGALVAIAPQLLGGAYTWGVLVIAALATPTLGLAVWANRGRTRMHGLLWGAMLLAFAWTIAQALPLPCGFMRALAPDSVHALERTQQVLQQSPPALCTLSRDPANTRLEIVKGVAILCTFCAAALLVQLGERRSVLRAIAIAGTLLALVSIAHAAGKATHVFGIYEPLDVRDLPFVAPLLSLNTLGGLLAACWPAATAFAITTRSSRTRALWLAASTAIAATALMTRSRGAVGALMVAIIVLGALGLRARVRSGHPARDPRARMGIAAAILASMAFIAYGFYAQLAHEFEAGGWDKLRLIAGAWSFSLQHPWAGIGRGAFSPVFAGVAANVVKRFVYPENFVVQWAAEWGLPVTGCLLAALGVALVQAIARTRSWERAAAVAGTTALAAQNVVDLGSELVGVAVAAAAMLAAAVHERDGSPAAESVPIARRWQLAPLSVLGALSTVALAPLLIRDELSAIEGRLRTASAQAQTARFGELLAQGMKSHPSEPNLPILAAQDALQRRDPAAGRYINRALELAPSWATPHAQAAVWLWNSGHRSQALLEVAIASRGNVYATRGVVCEIVKVWPAGIVAIADKTGQPGQFLYLAADCPTGSEQLDLALLRYAPNSAPARVRQARRAIAAQDLERALRLGREALQIEPGSVDAALVSYKALQLLKRPREALALIDQALKDSSSVRLRALQIQLLLQLGDRARLGRALSELRSTANSAEELAYAYSVEGETEVALHNQGAALRAYQQAFDVGGDPAALRRVAVIARDLGDGPRARRAYGELCAINPSDSESCTAASAPDAYPPGERSPAAARRP